MSYFVSELLESPKASSRNIPQAELDALRAAYQGKQCILTKGFVGIDWAHILPHDTTYQDRRITNMKSLKLVSSNFSAVNRENIIPINKADHSAFDAFVWTIYPDIPTLKRLIDHEETQLYQRSLAIEAGGSDPDRPEYDDFYGRLEQSLSYDVHFGIEYLNSFIMRQDNGHVYRIRSTDEQITRQLLSVNLICNVNVIVMMRTTALARSMLTDAAEALVLGSYLITLWHAEPKQRDRALGLRPVFLPPIPGSVQGSSTNPSNIRTPQQSSSTNLTAPALSDMNVDSSTLYKSHAGIPTPPESPRFRRPVLYASLEVCQSIAIRWYQVVFPTLLGEEIAAPPYILGRNKALTATEAARLCGVKLARLPTSTTLPDSAAWNVRELSESSHLNQDQDKVDMIKAWSSQLCESSWLDPNI